MSAVAAPAAHPKIGSLWTPVGSPTEVCEVKAACAVVVVVRWHARETARPCIYHGTEAFYRAFERRIAPFDPSKHVDRYAEVY